MDSVPASKIYCTLKKRQCWRSGTSQASASVKARPSGSCTGERGASSNLNHSLCHFGIFWSNSVKTQGSSTYFNMLWLWFLFEVCASYSLGTSRVQTKCTNPGLRLGQPMQGSCQMDKFQQITFSSGYNMTRTHSAWRLRHVETCETNLLRLRAHLLSNEFVTNACWWLRVTEQNSN